MAEQDETLSEKSFISQLISDTISSPINLALLLFIVFLVYKIIKSHTYKPPTVPEEKPLPKLRKDFTVEQLRPYDGTQPDGRILVAVNGQVFDCSRNRRFYGPGGPYAAFGGRDASRGLATFSVSCATEGYDDLSDLTPIEMESVREWETQFKEKYPLVGKLLKPGEAPTNYSDEEDEVPPADQEKSKDE